MGTVADGDESREPSASVCLDRPLSEGVFAPFRRTVTTQIGAELDPKCGPAAVAAGASVSGSLPARRLSPLWSSLGQRQGGIPIPEPSCEVLILLESQSSASLLFPATSELAGGQTDPRCLFGEMPPGEENGSAPPVRAGDRIGALSDDILHHLLSFLPVQSAVRTCVLARRWCHLWRSTTGLRIVGVQKQGPVQDLVKFLHHMLILRERSVLDTVEVEFSEFLKDDVPYVNLWTRFAVQWGVRALTVQINHREHLYLDGLPLFSRRMRTLHNDGLGLQESFLDFSSCPALEDLKMKFCEINVHKISSRSLKRLSIILLPVRPELPERASVDLGSSCDDFYVNCDDFGVFCEDNGNGCDNCVAYNDGSNECLLLGGISNAIHMELISQYDIFVFTRDLKQCPTFRKLKTLLLNEYWCVAPDLDPLACILKNSPVLEKLTLQLFCTGGDRIEMKGNYSSMERSSAISERLNIVEVKFHAIDKRVHKVLKFLCTFNRRFSFE